MLYKQLPSSNMEIVTSGLGKEWNNWRSWKRSQTTKNLIKSNLWKRELEKLQIICNGEKEKPADLLIRRKGVGKTPPDCQNALPAEVKSGPWVPMIFSYSMSISHQDIERKLKKNPQYIILITQFTRRLHISRLSVLLQEVPSLSTTEAQDTCWYPHLMPCSNNRAVLSSVIAFVKSKRM